MKIAVLLSRVPYPLEKGDKLRAFNQIKELSQRHEIYLYALNDKKIHPQAVSILSSYCKQIHIMDIGKWSVMVNMLQFFLRKKPMQCGYFYNARWNRYFQAQMDALQPDVIYAQLIRTAEYVRYRSEKKVLDYQDVFSKGMYRMMKRAKGPKAWVYKSEYKRLQRYEAQIFNDFDYKTIITQVDRDLIQHPMSNKIVVVPNGVDTQYFTPMKAEKKYDIIFTGNMSYLPNIYACEYLVKEILPQLQKRMPDIHVALCGVTPSSRVLALKSECVEVTGWVDDIREYYAKSKLFVAPMELGTGLQNKLLEAMSMGLPCITSPLASEPIKAVSNQEILVCNSVLGYVDAIYTLLHDQQQYQTISEKANVFVKQHYNWVETTKILEHLFECCCQDNMEKKSKNK
ncbi:MAG: glycosyltransferase [Bacteroidales bacterium]|nr:glycosyltransferase [Bacteroidales bacterium]